MASVNRLRLRLLLALLAKTLFFLLQARGEAGPGWAPAEARPTPPATEPPPQPTGLRHPAVAPTPLSAIEAAAVAAAAGVPLAPAYGH
jgi:hypothetical protein